MSAPEFDEQPSTETPVDAAGYHPLEIFADEPPRPLPKYVRHSRYVRSRRATVYSLAMIGSAFCATAPLPFVQTLSWYLLPLGYLDWIGWFLMALAICYLFRNLTSPGLLKYVREGRMLSATVQQVRVLIGGNQEHPTGQFVADLHFTNPETGVPQSLSIATPEAYAGLVFSKMESGLAPGDQVAVVYIPGQMEKAQILGWLGLIPDVDLLRRNGKPLKPASPLVAAGAVVGITLMFWLLLGFVYVIGRFMPLGDDGIATFFIAVGAAWAIFAAAFAFRAWLTRDKEPNRAKAYGLAVLYGLICGFLGGFTGLAFINGYFDESPRTLEPVKVVQLWHKTHDFILRTYELEYQEYPNGKTEKRTVPVETMSQFQPDTLAVIDIGQGRLGLKWLRDFYPIAWNSIPFDGKEPISGEIVFRSPNHPERVRIIPQVRISDTEYLPPPDVLIPELRSRMVTQLITNALATIEEPKKPVGQ